MTEKFSLYLNFTTASSVLGMANSRGMSEKFGAVCCFHTFLGSCLFAVLLGSTCEERVLAIDLSWGFETMMVSRVDVC